MNRPDGRLAEDGAATLPRSSLGWLRDGGTLIGNDTTAPYSVVYSNAAPGAHTLVVCYHSVMPKNLTVRLDDELAAETHV